MSFREGARLDRWLQASFSLSLCLSDILYMKTEAEDSASRAGNGVRDCYLVRHQPSWLVRCGGLATQLVIRSLAVSPAWNKLPHLAWQYRA